MPLVEQLDRAKCAEKDFSHAMPDANDVTEKLLARIASPAMIPLANHTEGLIRLPAPSTRGANATDCAARQGRVGGLDPYVACILNAAPVTNDIPYRRMEYVGTYGLARCLIEPLKVTRFVVDTALVDGLVAGAVGGKVGHREAGSARRVRRCFGELSGRT